LTFDWQSPARASGGERAIQLSNAGSLLRLGCAIACVAGIAACAQGEQSPGTEDLTYDGSAGAPMAGGSVVGISGALNNLAGSTARGGATGGAGRASGGSSNGGKSGGTGAGGKGGAAGAAGAGTAGSGTAGAGTGPQGCTHLQPGEAVGLSVQYSANAATASVPYIFFSVEVHSPDADSIPLSDFKLRYYFVNDLTNPMIDIYSPQIHHAQTTDNLSPGDVKTSFTPTYLEISFTSTAALLKTEYLSLQVHFSATPVVNHDQTNDYSWNSSTTPMPNCKIALFRGASNTLAWGTPEP
jgi:hypothetical protein